MRLVKLGFDVLESNEFYREWQVSPRISQQEMLNYASLQLGNTAAQHVQTELSQLSRDERQVGQQGRLSLQTDPTRTLSAGIKSFIHQGSDGKYDQQHAIRTALQRDRFRTELYGSLEEGLGSQFFQSNDHLLAGLSLQYQVSSAQVISSQYEQRTDYEPQSSSFSLLDAERVNNWTDLRRDLSSSYSYQNKSNISSKFQFKYREHENDSTGKRTYALGNLQLDLKGFEDRISFSGRYLLDEEHIPRYDFQYALVDTGYGEHWLEAH